MEKEKNELLSIAEGSLIDTLTKKILERLGRPSNRGKPPSEYYTDSKTIWVSSNCPSFVHDGNRAPGPEDLYTPRLFL